MDDQKYEPEIQEGPQPAVEEPSFQSDDYLKEAAHASSKDSQAQDTQNLVNQGTLPQLDLCEPGTSKPVPITEHVPQGKSQDGWGRGAGGPAPADGSAFEPQLQSQEDLDRKRILEEAGIDGNQDDPDVLKTSSFPEFQKGSTHDQEIHTNVAFADKQNPSDKSAGGADKTPTGGDGQNNNDAVNRLWGSENPLDSIKPEAIKQRNNNDCFLMSSMASLAQTNPEAIRDMIKPQLDADGKPIPGAYTVTFPGDKENPVNVQLKPEDIEKYGKIGEHGAWPTVLEKAYETHQRNAGAKDPLNEGSPTHALQLLTGKPQGETNIALPLYTYGAMNKLFGTQPKPEFVPSPMEQGQPRDQAQQTIENQVRGLLENNFPADGSKPHAPMVAFKDKPDTRNTNDKGMVSGHGYTVTGYDRNTGMVSLRNPWGAPGMPQGENFQMSLADFTKTFTKLHHRR